MIVLAWKNAHKLLCTFDRYAYMTKRHGGTIEGVTEKGTWNSKFRNHKTRAYISTNVFITFREPIITNEFVKSASDLGVKNDVCTINFGLVFNQFWFESSPTCVRRFYRKVCYSKSSNNPNCGKGWIFYLKIIRKEKKRTLGYVIPPIKCSTTPGFLG